MTIAGVQATTVVTPHDQAELASAVRECYAANAAFAFVGGGTELELGNAPTRLDTVIATTGLNRVIEYAPEDQTISVEAGMTVAAVSNVLAEHDQFIALDVADPERTTIGGAIATNAYGRRRLRFGTIKDNIVGIGIVRADGVAARGGGKVVKNVAGFDIPKLMVGALGTLGAVVSATFRVHPIDHASAAVVVRGLTIVDVMLVCAEIAGEALVPSSIVAYDAGERSDCVVAFDGFRRGVDEQVRALAAIAAKLGFLAEEVTASGMASYEAIERRVRGDGTWRVRLGAAPTMLAKVLANDGPVTGNRVYYPALGSALLARDELDAATIARWRGSLDHGTVVVTAMPQAMRSTVDAWGEPPPSIAFMRRLKANFDPKNLCSPGRFVGGL
jgi:glycolate oxidase FAD binding subunit